jgi:hypothetical protein
LTFHYGRDGIADRLLRAINPRVQIEKLAFRGATLENWGNASIFDCGEAQPQTFVEALRGSLAVSVLRQPKPTRHLDQKALIASELANDVQRETNGSGAGGVEPPSAQT